ncbi:unnamed protein product [Plutella xylostella]|uniref:(diamondback moth) hypothetical protein n=1 Tax=Plutella xylostella TaxID=51655 RepID=A0A8S4GE76_PLUXY|nr:unnamed protein product [Plutella xylostella]
MKLMEMLSTDTDLVSTLSRKMAPPSHSKSNLRPTRAHETDGDALIRHGPSVHSQPQAGATVLHSKTNLTTTNPPSFYQVLMKLMEMLSTETDLVSTLSRKLAPPLVTLLSAEPEVQYVALRNINLVVQKRPDILKHEMKVFFVKYNDPIYVKLEKLDIMIRLASQANIAQVLGELKEYATEVDVDFVRKAVRAIGRCAIKLQKPHTRLRLASQANIAQVLGELKEYAAEVDVDFVRKAVRAIGRAAIKVRVAARAARVSYHHR